MKEAIHVIAEGGTNHNGNIGMAKQLIDIASESKADSVKFQIIYPEGLYLPGEYSYGHYDIKEVIKIRTDGMLSSEEYDEVAIYCKEKKIAFAASVFDIKGLDLLMKFDPPYIKTASCDLNNIGFLREVAQRGKKMIISTGMSTLSDIEKSLNSLAKDGFEDIVLLHCVSVYPAVLAQTNLGFIDTLKTAFGYQVGFSDHTGDSIAACMALAKGAVWFEKHFTIDKSLKGFDHAYALEKDELRKYVKDLHAAKDALTRKTKISNEEFYTRKRARRSIYAARDLKPGDVLQEKDLLIVRPEGILDADQIDLVTGSTVTRNINRYQAISLSDIRL